MKAITRPAAMAGLLAAMLCLAAPPRAAGQKGKAKEPAVQGKAISAWVKELEGKDLLGRVRAINALMVAGPEARRAAPVLIAIFGEKDATLLHPLAVLALSRMGPEAVPELQKGLESKVTGVRSGSAMTLGLIGAAGRPAVPALEKVLKDDDAGVRQAAAQA